MSNILQGLWRVTQLEVDNGAVFTAPLGVIGENILIEGESVTVRPNTKVKSHLALTGVTFRAGGGSASFKGTWGAWDASLTKLAPDTLLISYDTMPGRTHPTTREPFLVKYTLTRVTEAATPLSE